MEEWKPVVGYEGLYEVSNYGEIKSLIGWDSKKYINRIKILKQSNTTTGYKKVELYKLEKKKSHRIHRLVAIAFLPNPNKEKYVNHKDLNKTNNFVDNLEFISFAGNVKHGYENGAHSNYFDPIGEKKCRLKFLYEDGISTTKIALEFKCTQQQVFYAVKRFGFSKPDYFKRKYEIDRDAMFEMFNSGTRNRDIAKFFNITRFLVSTMKNKYLKGDYKC